MDTKKIAVTIAFAALTIVLNTLRIPTIYWPGFFYRVYEIPIAVAFFLFGPKIGILVATLNLLGQLVFFPVPGGIAAYPFGLMAILTMMFRVYLATIIFNHRLQLKSAPIQPHIVLTNRVSLEKGFSLWKLCN